MLNNSEQDIITGFHKLYYDRGQEGGTWLNTRWMGVPILKCPLDLWIYQEIIFEIKPEIIIECGTFNGGSALFLAHLCDIIGYGEIVSIDIDERSGRPQHSRISYWAGSSISEQIIERVRQKVSGRSPVLVILDSDHSANHVIQELRLYSPLVTPGSYVIVEDTNINGHPVFPDFGSGPMEAVQAFLSENSSFSVATDCEKLYLTFNPSGYLKRSFKNRKEIAEKWLELSPDQLESNYLSSLGREHQLLLDSKNHNKYFLTEAEQVFLKKILEKISRGFDDPKAIQYILAAMLYCNANQLPLSHDLPCIPEWFFNDYLKFLLGCPPYFQEPGDSERYYRYFRETIDYLHSSIFQNKTSAFWQDVASQFLQVANFIPLYFNEANLKDIYVKRAEILEYALKLNGHEIDYNFSSPSAKYRKNRIGILASHFTPAAETFASLPVYEYLSRDFEVILYSLSHTGHPLEQYCQSCANSFKLLPNNLTDQVNLIRSDDLDILFVATNITAGTNQICLLSMHRLARLQVTSVSSVVTTGIRHMDYYISGKLTDWCDDAEQHYQEKLLKLDGSAHCFSYGSEQNNATIKVSRESVGIAESAVVFICGANLFKITPELSNSWAKIIAGVPNSVLVLYPFGPNWSNTYAKEVFKTHLNKTFDRYGVELDRLLILDPNPIPNRDDIKEYLKLANIYLDSYPFAGTTSVIDPLEVGLPVVARQGTCFRSAMGAALVQELAMPDLVASSEDSYIQIAIALGTDRELRQQKSEHIQQKMLSKPRFLDSRSYSAQMGALFQELIRKYHIDDLDNYLGLKDINLIIFPDWSQSEELISQDLVRVIRAIATHPHKSKMTLLVDSSNISDEDASLALSGVAMNLLMEEDLDVSDGPEISLIGQLSEIQREILISRLQGRIVLENENIEAIAQAKAENIALFELDSLKI